MSTGANPDVYAWRWFDDSSNVNSPATLPADPAINTSVEVPFADLGNPYFLYVGIENTGDMAANGDYTIAADDGGGPVLVTTTSNNVRVIAGLAADTDVITTPGQLGAGAGTWSDGEYDDVDGVCATNLPGLGYTNYCFSIEFRAADLSGGESIDFVCRSAGADCTNDSGATINVTIGAAPAGGSNPVPTIIQNYRNMGY